MTVRPNNARPTSLTRRLDAYAAQARSRPGVVTSRPLAYGALASIVPLAASVGDARAQDFVCYSPVSSIIELDSVFNSEPILIATATGTETAGYLQLILGGEDPILQFQGSPAIQPFYPTTGPRFAIRNAASDDLVRTNLTNFFWTYAYLCVSAASQVGFFCPGDGRGFLPLLSEGVIFLELNVLEFGTDTAAVAIGPLQIAADSVHAGDCSASLPVELAAFEGRVVDGTPVLQWETASELNNAGFEIQRASSRSRFERIGFVQGHGTTADAQRYDFRDESARANVGYRYRLKQIDLDGTTSFSPIVEVFTEAPDVVVVGEVYPNPVNRRGARIDINLAESEDATIEVYDVRGALVATESRVLNRGQNRVSLITDGSARGAHFAKVQIGERVVYRPFVVVE